MGNVWSSLRTVVIGLLILVLTIPSGIAAADTRAENSDPWQVHTTIKVHKNGTATVTIAVNRSIGRLGLDKDEASNFRMVSHEDAVEIDRSEVVWDTSIHRRITFKVQLGRARYGSGVTDEWVIFRTTEIAPVRGWSNTKPPARRLFEIKPPQGWLVAAPGQKVDQNTYRLETGIYGPETYVREMFAVGDFSVVTRQGEGYKVRVVKLPSAGGPSATELANFLKKAIPVLERATGTETEFPRLAIIAPPGIVGSGAARLHSITVTGDRYPLYKNSGEGSIYLHELVHTYNRIPSHMAGQWVSEGLAEYLNHYTLWKMGKISEREFQKIIQDAVHHYSGDIPQTTAISSPYTKGEAVWAALDMDIRARTDNSKSAITLIRRLNSYEKWIYKSEFLSELKKITGTSYEKFYSNYITGSKFPMEIISDEYSLSDPVKVTHGKIPRSKLTQTIQGLRTRLEKRNQTIQGLRTRLEKREQGRTEMQSTSTGGGEAQSEAKTTATSGPGFGAASALTGLGGVGYLLLSRTDESDDD